MSTFAKFDTTEGSFTVRFFDDEVPSTVANFVGLAEGTKPWTDPRTGEAKQAPFYDGIIFHRVIDGFMIQGGDPLGRGYGGPGFKFADEFHPTLRHDRAGILSMANSGPNTNGSQFFITLGADAAPRQPPHGIRCRRGWPRDRSENREGTHRRAGPASEGRRHQ